MPTTFVAAGTASQTNGAAPTPGLPAGLTAGDLMIIVVGGWDLGFNASTSISAGWDSVVANVNPDGEGIHIACWSRVYQVGDAAPTLTQTNHTTGASGESCIAQIAAWRGPASVTEVGTVDGFHNQANIGPLAGITIDANETVVVVGIKTDDWTDVTTLSGDSLTWVEIGEPDGTAGLDCGLVWDYAIDGGSGTTVTNKTFTVNGGLAVDSCGFMMSLAAPVEARALHRLSRGVTPKQPLPILGPTGV